MLFAIQASVGLVLAGAVLALVSMLQTGDIKDKTGFFGGVLFILGVIILFFCGATTTFEIIFAMFS